MWSDTVIIIPAYNEEKSITDVISSIKEKYPDVDVVVINDGSTDNTANLSKEAGAIVLSLPYNMGYGTSVQTGYKYAARHDYEFLVQIDGDGQHDTGGIEYLLKSLKGGAFDIVMGSRFLGPNNYVPPIFRRIGIIFFRFCVYLLSGHKISDPTTGFQAINKKVIKLFTRDLFPSDYPDADMIILLSKLNLKIKEIPIKMYPNREGKSMHNSPLKVIYYVFKMILIMIITKLRKIDPIE